MDSLQGGGRGHGCNSPLPHPKWGHGLGFGHERPCGCFVRCLLPLLVPHSNDTEGGWGAQASPSFCCAVTRKGTQARSDAEADAGCAKWPVAPDACIHVTHAMRREVGIPVDVLVDRQ